MPAEGQQQRPTVFISYAHESDALRASVKALADWLADQGCLVLTDHPYVHRPPERGWQVWMHDCVRKADTVLVVCTPKLKARYEKNEEPGTGFGATFEGAIVTQHIYDDAMCNTKFFPVIPDGGSYDDVPTTLRPWWNRHSFPSGNEGIRCMIFNMPAEDPPAGPLAGGSEFGNAGLTTSTPDEHHATRLPGADKSALLSEARPVAEAPPVRILHLSDIHFKASRAWDADPVLRALAKFIEREVAEGLVPDLVVISGDLAFAGIAEEYAYARDWLEKRLWQAVGGLPRDRLLIVPGNHDVDRSRIDRMTKLSQRDLLQVQSQDEIADVLNDDQQRRIMLKRRAAYLDFVSEWDNKPQTLPWWQRVIEIRGIRLHIAGLDSAWMASGDEDRGRLLLGRYQLAQTVMTEEAEDADWRIAMLHHPWDYFAEFDCHPSRQAIHQHCELLLRGHLHSPQSERILPPDPWRGCLELAAGCVYENSQYPNAFQWIELLPNKRIRVLFRAWMHNAWAIDHNQPNCSEGWAQFCLESDEEREKAEWPAGPSIAHATLRKSPVQSPPRHVDVPAHRPCVGGRTSARTTSPTGISKAPASSKASDGFGWEHSTSSNTQSVLPKEVGESIFDNETAEDHARQQENEKRLKKLRNEICKKLKSSKAALVELEVAMGFSASPAGDAVALSDDKRMERLVEELMYKKDFLAGKAALLQAYNKLRDQERHDGVDALRGVSRLLIPWLYVTGFPACRQLDGEWWRGTLTGDVLVLPARLRTFAEIVMAGLDRREVKHRNDDELWPTGAFAVRLEQPESGIPDATEDNLRTDLFRTLKAPMDHAKSDPSTQDRAIISQLKYWSGKGFTPYLICDQLSRNEQERRGHEECLKRISGKYRGLAIVELGGLVEINDQDVFNEIRDLLLPYEP